jgi:hypothetical protein
MAILSDYDKSGLTSREQLVMEVFRDAGMKGTQVLKALSVAITGKLDADNADKFLADLVAADNADNDNPWQPAPEPWEEGND